MSMNNKLFKEISMKNNQPSRLRRMLKYKFYWIKKTVKQKLKIKNKTIFKFWTTKMLYICKNKIKKKMKMKT